MVRLLPKIQNRKEAATKIPRQRKRVSTSSTIRIDNVLIHTGRLRTSTFVKGKRFGSTTKKGLRFNARRFGYNEIIIDGKVLRVNLITNCLNLKLNGCVTRRSRMLNNNNSVNNSNNNKSILKQQQQHSARATPLVDKSVSFSRTHYITEISSESSKSVTLSPKPAPPPPQVASYPPPPPPPAKDYESMYREYLKSVQMNGSSSGATSKSAASKSVTTAAAVTLAGGNEGGGDNNNTSAIIDDDDPYDDEEEEEEEDEEVEEEEDEEGYDDEDEGMMEMDVLEDESDPPPKRKRGRPPKGESRPKLIPPPSPRKRGWPLGVSRKQYRYLKSIGESPFATSTPVSIPTLTPPSSSPRGRRGRPRKVHEFTFQSIVSEIKDVTLPSDLWSAHVSVTAKKSQVCFTRVVQVVSSNVPVECDRSVKFNGTVDYLVRINNRDVELLAAPAVGSLKDIEILLDIVNDISINDPILEYLDR